MIVGERSKRSCGCLWSQGCNVDCNWCFNGQHDLCKNRTACECTHTCGGGAK